MRKIYYIIVVVFSLILISCQENDVADNNVIGQLKGEVSFSFGIDHTEDNVVLGVSDETGGNTQEKVFDNQLLVLIESKNVNSNNESFAFYSYDTNSASINNPNLDMQMFYGENNVTLKCFDMYSLSADLSSLLGIPEAEKGETSEEYTKRVSEKTSWNIDLATSAYQTRGGKIAFKTSNFEFFGATKVNVQGEVKMVGDITLFRLTSNLQFDLSELAKSCPENYEWTFTLSLNKESIDLYNEKNNNNYNLDKVYINSYLKHLQMPEPSLLDEEVLVSVTKNQINIEPIESSKGYFNDFLTEMNIDQTLGLIETSAIEQNSYGVASVSYQLSKEKDVIAEGMIKINSDIYTRDNLLPILRLHTNHKVVIKASGAIYTDDYLYDTHLIFEQLDYEETTIIISDDGGIIVA